MAPTPWESGPEPVIAKRWAQTCSTPSTRAISRAIRGEKGWPNSELTT